MKLVDIINQDIVTAMKSKDVLKLSVLRMVKAAMTHAAIEKKKDSLEDNEALEILIRQVKQRRESFELFEKAGRHELAAQEKAEIGIVELYLPAPLSPEELQKLVLEAIEASGAKIKADFSKVMAIVMPKVKGRADGKTVSTLIQSSLS